MFWECDFWNSWILEMESFENRGKDECETELLGSGFGKRARRHPWGCILRNLLFSATKIEDSKMQTRDTIPWKCIAAKFSFSGSPEALLFGCVLRNSRLCGIHVLSKTPSLGCVSSYFVVAHIRFVASVPLDYFFVYWGCRRLSRRNFSGLVLEKPQGAIPWLRPKELAVQCHSRIRSFRALVELMCFRDAHTLKVPPEDGAVAVSLD